MPMRGEGPEQIKGVSMWGGAAQHPAEGAAVAWQYNRPCAQKYVCKFQSCMIISGSQVIAALRRSGFLIEELEMESAGGWDTKVPTRTKSCNGSK